ncbi:MAG: helix-turn-helix domain-containing protein [bacterium]
MTALQKSDFVLENKNYVREEKNKFVIKRTDRSKPDWNAKHFHDTYEIWYVLQGETKCFIEDKNYIVSNGDLLLIDKNILHRIMMQEQENTPERYVMEFKEDFLWDYLNNNDANFLLDCFKKNIYILQLNLKEQFVIEDIFYKMLQEGKKQQPGFIYNLFFLTGELLLKLNRSLERISENKQEKHGDVCFSYNHNDSAADENILNLIKFINRNYTDNLDLDTISEKVHMSKYHFCRKFKDITGFTFVEYLNNYRVKEAQRILKNSDINVTRVSGEVGYNSISQFYKMFKKITGTSPLQYRKKFKQ